MHIKKTHSLKTRFILTTLLLFLVFIGIAGRWLYFEVQEMIRSLGERYAVERVESARLQLARSLEREAALAQKLAHSPVVIDWMLDDENPEKRRRAFAELASYRNSFADSNSFVGILSSRRYYNWGEEDELVTSTMSREVESDQWFFQTIESGKPISFNLDYNVNVDVSRVWINCLVTHKGKPMGLAGTGLEITNTVSRLVSSENDGTNVMLIGPGGVILAHRNSDIMAKNAKVEKQEKKITVFDLMEKEAQRKKFNTLITQAASGTTAVGELAIEGETGLTAMLPSTSLDAYVVASVDTSEFLSIRDFTPMFILLTAALILGLSMITVLLQRLVLRPLACLTDSAEKIAEGKYDLSISVKGSSEIAVLSSAFNRMTEKIRDYTRNLEGMVKERTSQLQEVNDQLTKTNTRMMESIRYAGMIQNGIMPEERMLAELFSRYSLFFRQRDIVGGDMQYIHRVRPEDPFAGFLIATIDCEGHGVSGALMTMMTESVLEHVVPAHDPHNPAAILEEAERKIRKTLSAGEAQGALQSGFDIGLCACFPREEKLIFAGAGMPLYVRDKDGTVSTVKGRHKAIRNRHRLPPEAIENIEIGTADNMFFLVTDGFVDQSGGEKERSYGTRRLYEFIAEFPDSEKGFEGEFDRYRGVHAQRDDVLVVAFSFTQSGPYE